MRGRLRDNKFLQRHPLGRRRLDMLMPLLIIARRLKCARCNERRAQCWTEPYALALGDQSLNGEQKPPGSKHRCPLLGGKADIPM